MKKYYFISGEASGDLHGSHLAAALLEHHPCQIRGWGGDLMRAARVDIVKHYKDLAFMGFVEVAKNIKSILSNFKECKKDILEFNPDTVVLIDYPGFNLRMAKWAKKHGFNVVYYIAPQLWAWHESRVKVLKENVDELIVILPFEKKFFAGHEMSSHFVGHPLVDIIDEKEDDPYPTETPHIALLPGSRRQEVERILPIMMEVAKKKKDWRFSIAGTQNLGMEFYDCIADIPENVELNLDDTYNILSNSDLAAVSSGTATLETALHGVPQVVTYRGNGVSFWLAKKLVSVPYISLVNLIMNDEVVKELIQEELTSENLIRELELLRTEKNSMIKTKYSQLRERLGEGGASSKAAHIISQI